jgi:hypothetical protein
MAPPVLLDDRPLTLIGQLQRALRMRHYSPRTEEAYVSWTRRFVRFHGLRHPRQLGPTEVRAFLGSLDRRVTASTQNQAFSALAFLYRDVLRMWGRSQSMSFSGPQSAACAAPGTAA